MIKPKMLWDTEDDADLCFLNGIIMGEVHKQEKVGLEYLALALGNRGDFATEEEAIAFVEAAVTLWFNGITGTEIKL